MNKYDKKGRPEVGFADMEDYEFGGLEVEDTLQNGYLLYVPYGIHKDVFDAIEHAMITMRQSNTEMEDLIMKTAELENIPNSVKDAMEKNFKSVIEKRKKHIKVLEAILPISEEI